MALMKTIGNPVKLNSTADPGGRANTKFRSFMNVVDIVPVDWEMNLITLTKEDPNYVIKYDFKKAMKKFSEDCVSYGLAPADGLRCLLTGETVAQEEISNQFDKNKVESALNSLSSYMDTARSLGKSVGGDLNKDAASAAKRGLESAMAGGGETGNAVKNLGKLAIDIVMEGKQVSLPKIWHGSNYNPSLALNVELISPYGSQAAILEHVVKPLTYLLILAAPETSDGISYGKVRYIHMKGYGISNINLGYIESISINRGGGDVTYNKWRQPLSVTASLSIKPAAEGFAMVSVKSKNTDIGSIGSVGIPGSPTSLQNPGPAFTTVGTVLNSFRPVPIDVMGPDLGALGMTLGASASLSNAISAGKDYVDQVNQQIKDATGK